MPRRTKVESLVLQWWKLGNKALRQMPASPAQRATQEARAKVEQQLQRLGVGRSEIIGAGVFDRSTRRRSSKAKKVAPVRGGYTDIVARRAARKNPPAGVLVSRDVRAVQYLHAQSSTRAAYEHEFGKGVEMWALRDGTVLLKSAYGFPLHGQFSVKDSE